MRNALKETLEDTYGRLLMNILLPAAIISFFINLLAGTGLIPSAGISACYLAFLGIALCIRSAIKDRL